MTHGTSAAPAPGALDLSPSGLPPAGLAPAVLSPGDLSTEDLRAATRAELPVVVVDLDAGPTAADVGRAAELVRGFVGRAITVGLTAGTVTDVVRPLVDELTLTLAPAPLTGPSDRPVVGVDDPRDALRQILRVVGAAPTAALTLEGLLRVTAATPVREGLVAESLAYSMLQSGPEFLRWRAARPRRDVPAPTRPVVALAREGSRLVITLDRPERRNAFSVATREELLDALLVAELATDIEEVVLEGTGPIFCAGGDLDEFGTAPDGPTAHAIRLDRSVGARLHGLRARVTARVHGACIGAGIELPAFASTVLARPGTVFRLPELTLGLVPGAGGTVSVTRRVGRWRCAFMALTDARIDTPTALEWGLVDGTW